MSIESLPLQPELLRAVKDLGFTEPTPIQEQCIPEIKLGHDVVGQSSTGSGKTAAFGLPILEGVSVGRGLQAVILTPTRELCVQVADALRDFSRFLKVRITTIYGGVDIQPQIRDVRDADIVVATPGRLLDHLERRTVSFDKVKYFVLDEADKMFEMGFIEDVERIMSVLPPKRQTLLFSATILPSVQALIKKQLRNPRFIRTQSYVDKALLRQTYYVVKPFEKFSLLVHLLRQKSDQVSLVFCATRREVDVVVKNLHRHGIDAMAIHGGLRQNKRTRALDSLKQEKITVLVATDVAARGIDVRNITHVYNYDVPKTPGEYVHRIGRTARAGTDGDAVTLVTERDYENFNRVLSDRSLEIKREELPRIQMVPFRRHEQQPHSTHRPYGHFRKTPQQGYGRGIRR